MIEITEYIRVEKLEITLNHENLHTNLIKMTVLEFLIEN